METKKEIRHKIIRLRKEMDPLVWQQATNDITERVINHPRFLEETDIYCYANYNGEVGTSSIMEEAWKLGKSVWFPRIEGSKMNFYLVESKDDLQPGAYGILEPTGNHIADGEDGLLIMPGVAFDEECHRIGYGGGFYDKYLEKHPNLHAIAIAFELQMYRELPFEEHDIKPEKVVTEKQSYPLDTEEKSLLLSVVNTKLRDYYHNLDALCDDMNVEKEEIVNTLKTIDYEYDENRHQFV